MGLWLKCPGCQAKTPLSLKVCPNCGQDLDKLATNQRVYVIGAAEPTAAPAPAPPQAAAPVAAAVTAPAASAAEPAATAKAAKKPRKTKKKKA